MKAIVCGGRNYSDQHRLFSELDGEGISVVIHGCASGADMLAVLWAVQMGIPVVAFPADWDKHGRAAGPIRNKQMLDDGKPDIVIAFPGGRGTENMISQAEAAGVLVRRIEP